MSLCTSITVLSKMNGLKAIRNSISKSFSLLYLNDFLDTKTQKIKIIAEINLRINTFRDILFEIKAGMEKKKIEIGPYAIGTFLQANIYLLQLSQDKAFGIVT